ncbi:hypothetical protein B0H65DRAFT_447033 [Neurospora tetraspora]|uniref:Uncharacterized protein n=1 Tax=Neurospora tetraspora TaxID=94610 RepID=A0AAE0MJD3_9PEZI|nr:hypothetical protein B0H65DRAFT_447033 [Neurospora tetraspora]
MVSTDSRSCWISNPYERLGDWAKQFTCKGANEPAKQDWEEEGDRVMQEKQNNLYRSLEEWAKGFEKDDEQGADGPLGREGEEWNACPQDSTEKRAIPDADDPIDNHGDDSEGTIDENTITNGENAKDQKKDKQTRCKHKSVMSGLLRTFFNSPALCEYEQETASVVQSRRDEPVVTGRSFRQSSATGTSNGHNEANSSSTSPTNIEDDYVHVARHPGMYALPRDRWNPRPPVANSLIPIEAGPCTAVRPDATNESDVEWEEDSDWDMLSDMFDTPTPECQQGK